MATQTWIIGIEEKVLRFQADMATVKRCVREEAEREGNGKLMKENCDVYGTLVVNLKILSEDVSNLAQEIQKRRNLA